MYKLYWAPGTAAMAPQTVLEEIGAAYQPILLDLATKQHEQADYKRLSAEGVVFRGEPQNYGAVIGAVFEDSCGNLINLVQPLM